MGWGLFKPFSMTMGATSGSCSVDLGQGFQNVYLQIPTMASSTGLDVYVKASSSESFYQLRMSAVNTTTVQNWTFAVAATAAANGSVVPLPAGFQYYKFIAADSAPTAALSFKLLCKE